MDTIRLSIQQIDAIAVENSRQALLYPHYRIWPNAVAKVLPPNSQDINPKDPANLMLVYSDQEKHFYVALPPPLLTEPLKIGSQVRLRYEYITDSKDVQNAAFEWTAEIRSFADVMQIPANQQSLIMLYSVSTEMMVFTSFFCDLIGCDDAECSQLPPDKWYSCREAGCCQ